MNANDFPPEFLNGQRAERERSASPKNSRSLAGQCSSDVLLKEEVFSIVGCAMAVLNGLGHGLHEKPYENALVVEFARQGIPFVQQPRYPILYRGVNVGEFVPDLIAFNAVVIDAKVIETITAHERGQTLNYLRISRHRVGVILNFKRAKLEWERLVLDTDR